MELHDKLKEIRKCLRYSQEEFGKEVGVDQRSVSNYETGLRQPSYKVLLRYTEFIKKNKLKIKLI